MLWNADEAINQSLNYQFSGQRVTIEWTGAPTGEEISRVTIIKAYLERHWGVYEDHTPPVKFHVDWDDTYSTHVWASQIEFEQEEQ